MLLDKYQTELNGVEYLYRDKSLPAWPDVHSLDWFGLHEMAVRNFESKQTQNKEESLHEQDS